MPEQPPPPAREKFWDKYENWKDVNKINIYCVTSGAGSSNMWFWKLSFLSQTNLNVSSYWNMFEQLRSCEIRYTRVREMIKNENEPLK